MVRAAVDGAVPPWVDCPDAAGLEGGPPTNVIDGVAWELDWELEWDPALNPTWILPGAPHPPSVDEPAVLAAEGGGALSSFAAAKMTCSASDRISSDWVLP